MPTNSDSNNRTRRNNNNSNIVGLRFFNEPEGKPPKHPKAPKGKYSRHQQKYPNIQYKPITVANKLMRFRNAKTLKNKYVPTNNFKKNLVFGIEKPKTWAEIQRMTIPEYRNWTKTLSPTEKAEMMPYL